MDNHELAKSLVGHPYDGRLTSDENIIIVDMIKSIVKLRNILLTLKENNANSYIIIKKVYNAKNAYRSFTRGSNTKMQQLVKLHERDQYIHWHRLKDKDVVRDLFWSPNVVNLSNAYNLVFFIDSTYKTNRYWLSLPDIVGVTLTGMTFFVALAYYEGECLNNVVWALEHFLGIFLICDALLEVIVTDRDLTLMSAVKIVFPESTNLLCRFHIDKNVRTKCKILVGKKYAWDYVMEAWESLVDCPSKQEFDECLMKFEIACSP